MGKRKPEEHVLEREASGRLTYVLSDWVINEINDDDYGIDFVAKPTTHEGEQLGTEIDIQLKSSESYGGTNTISQRLDTDALEDYMRSRKPVFLVVYERESGELYWELIQEYIWEEYGRDPSTWKNQQTVTVRLNRRPLSDTREDLIEVAQNTEKPIYQYVLEEAVMDFMLGRVSRNEVRKALRDGESQSLEFMKNSHGNISEVAVGMANSGGGMIVIGVGENTYSGRRKILGVDNEEYATSSIRRDLERVQPEIDADIRIEHADGSPVVVVEVPPYQDLPHADNGTFYVRQGSNTQYMSPSDLKKFFTD